MLKENQIIKIDPSRNSNNNKRFNEKGYSLSSDGYYYIKAQDLCENSHIRVKVICDGCGTELGMEYRQYTRKSKKYKNGEYYCKFCAPKTKEVKTRRINGMIKAYGVSNPMLDKNLKKKCMEYCSQNCNVPTSKAQLYIFNTLKLKYENTFLNYLESNSYLDCVVFVNDVKIDIEYDGWYWHQDKQKDCERDSFLQKLGYKIFRIKGGRKNPSENEIFSGIDFLLNNKENYYEIKLSDFKEITK